MTEDFDFSSYILLALIYLIIFGSIYLGCCKSTIFSSIKVMWGKIPISQNFILRDILHIK